jgi:hypothetical protein
MQSSVPSMGKKHGKGFNYVFGALIAVIVIAQPLAIVAADERGGEVRWLAAVALVFWLAAAVLLILAVRINHTAGLVAAACCAALSLIAAANPTVNSDGLGGIVVIGLPLFADFFALMIYIALQAIPSSPDRQA